MRTDTALAEAVCAIANGLNRARGYQTTISVYDVDTVLEAAMLLKAEVFKSQEIHAKETEETIASEEFEVNGSGR